WLRGWISWWPTRGAPRWRGRSTPVASTASGWRSGRESVGTGGRSGSGGGSGPPPPRRPRSRYAVCGMPVFQAGP
ncbi:MAG: hypothetical protein AVDCRST_MAG05-294, partial [uncultured Rubrobacteraceae bacterium]